MFKVFASSITASEDVSEAVDAFCVLNSSGLLLHGQVLLSDLYTGASLIQGSTSVWNKSVKPCCVAIKRNSCSRCVTWSYFESSLLFSGIANLTEGFILPSSCDVVLILAILARILSQSFVGILLPLQCAILLDLVHGVVDANGSDRIHNLIRFVGNQTQTLCFS